MREFRMPQLGADMAAGTLTEWLCKPGDRVAHGDIIAVVETDKGAIEVEVFEEGTISELLVLPGTKVPVGTVLATLDGGDDKASADQPEPVRTPAPDTSPAPPSAPSQKITTPAPTPSKGRVRISPAAARLAAARAINIDALHGTGPEGAIRLADIEAAISSTTVPDAPPDTPADAMRRAIAAAMGRSKREIPHYYLSTRIDMRRALDWLADKNEMRPVTERLLYSVVLIKAVARTLETYPEFSGFWQDNRFVPGESVRIGWAVSLRGGGLIAPALPDVSDMNADAVMGALRDLVRRARAMRLRSSEFSAPTITITNLGDQGVETVFGVIYPPQVALVGFGKIVDETWAAEDHSVTVRPVIRASLAGDHRVSDGHRGGLFLKRIGQYLQEPESL